MAPFLRYVATMCVALYTVQVVSYVAGGSGMNAALAWSAYGMVWVGWIAVLVGLPMFAVFLWVLPRAYVRFAAVPRWIIGAAIGFLVWAIAAVLLGCLATAAIVLGRGSSAPPSPLSIAGLGIIVGALGGLVGLVEARFSRWSP